MWRLTKDEKPDKNVSVLLAWDTKRSCQFGYYEGGHWYVCNNGDYTDGGYGQDYQCGDGRCFPEPTYWMHEPKPPK